MPWLDDLPQLRRPFDLAELARDTHGLDVESVVYVQVDVTPAYGLLEARWAADLDQRVAGIVAWAPMEDGDVVGSYLDTLSQMGPRLKAIRRLIQSEEDPEFQVRPDFLRAVRMLPKYGLSFDVCIRHTQLAKTIEMVRLCPETSFVLDHLGKPDVRTHTLDPWREQLAELAAQPNVACKVSGVVTEADHTAWTAAELEPYVAHALAVFGEDRVMFGGDWPVVTLASGYRRWVETLEQLTVQLSSDAKHTLWFENARRFYRL
jgi:L-fuconolactonase